MKWFRWKKEITTLPPLEAYNRWAASYTEENNPIKSSSDLLTTQWMPNLMNRSFLDAGCGTGQYCGRAVEQGASEVLGLDLSPAMIEIAKKNSPSATFQCVDIARANIREAHYDVINCALVLGHLELLEPALNNLLRGLKTGGRLILTDFHPLLTLQRAKRTFRDRGSNQTFAVEHYPHLFEDYFEIFQRYPVKVASLKEPCFQHNPVVFGILVVREP